MVLFQHTRFENILVCSTLHAHNTDNIAQLPITMGVGKIFFHALAKSSLAFLYI